MTRATITGFLELQCGNVFLADVLGIYADVLGIYADRATPRRPGHWLKLRAENAKGLVKVYVEGLTVQQRRLIEAAGRFNQTVEMLGV